MNLSAHFTLDELTRSQVAVRRGLDNQPAPLIVANLKRVAQLLEEVRALVGRPLIVSSGYRSPAVNKAVGGATNSAHVLGLAADIICSGISSRTLAILIQDSGIGFDQLIWEGTWVHLGLRDGGPRREVLTATFVNGRAQYAQGIA